MRVLLFRFITLIKCLKQNSLLNSVVFFSMMIGLFYPCCLLASFNLNLSNREVILEKQKEDFVLAEIMMPFQREEEIRSAFQSQSFNQQKINISVSLLRIPAFLKSGSSFASLQGMDRSGFELKNQLLSGRLPTPKELEENRPVTLITMDFMQRTGSKIGDFIQVNGKNFEVIGSIIRGNLLGQLLVPYGSIEELSFQNNLQYQLVFEKMKMEPEQIRQVIEKNYPAATILSVKSKQELFVDQNFAFQNMISVSLSQSIFTLFLSIFATTLIACVRLKNAKRTLAIKLVNGACRKDIVIDCILETFFFSFFAMVIDLIFLYFLQNTFSSILFLFFSPRLLFLCFFTVTFFSIVVGLVSGLVVARTNVFKLLQE